MSGRAILVDVARGLLFLFALFGLLLVPFGGGCALIFTLDRARELTLPLAAAMAVSVVGNIALLRFVTTGDRPGTVGKSILTILAILDFIVAAVAGSQAGAGQAGALALAAVPLVKGLLTFVFAFVERDDGPPSFPPLGP